MEHAVRNSEKAGRPTGNWKPTAIRITALVLAAVFALAGILKLIGPLLGIKYFAGKFVYEWEYGYSFLVFTAVVEIAAAVLLLKPRTRYIGAMAVVFIMIGAIITHKKFGDPGSAFILPALLLAAAIFITWNARHITAESGKNASDSADS